MKVSVLGSGSTGNAVLLVANGTRVLVDAGLSAREIARRMSLLGEDANSLDGILITHEHGDHAGGLRVLMKDLDCPVFMSAKTRDAYVGERRNVMNDEPRKRADALCGRMVEIDSGRDFCIGEIDFHPRREGRDRDGLWPYHNSDDRASSWLRGDRDRVESQPRHAEDGRAISVGAEAANPFAAGPSL